MSTNEKALNTEAEGNTNTNTNNRKHSQRKFFALSVDVTINSSPNHVWENEDEMMKSYPANRKLSFGGMLFNEVPKISFDRKKRRGSLRDAYPIFSEAWLVNDRLKQLFESIDPEGFDFFATEVDYSNFSEPGPAYWFCSLSKKRIFDCVDEKNSVILYYEDTPFKRYSNLTDVKLFDDVVGNAHVFLLEYSAKRIIDDVLLNALKKEKIKGFDFDPIQK